MSSEMEFLYDSFLRLSKSDQTIFGDFVKLTNGEENPAEKFKKKSPLPKKPSEKKKKPKKSSKTQVPTKPAAHQENEVELMDNEPTHTTPTKPAETASKKTPTDEATLMMPTRDRRTPPPPTPGKATPMKRPRSSSDSPDYSSVLKKRLTDDDGFILVTRKKTPDRNKPSDPQPSEKPKTKPQRPKPLVAEGKKLENCSSPTEVGQILELDSSYRVSRTKAGTFLIYTPNEKARETIKRSSPEITVRDTRATTNSHHFPVIIKNIPASWDTSALEDKYPTRRLMSAKTGKQINKVKILCSDADTQSSYLERGIIVNRERFRCEPFKPAKEPTQCYKCQSFGHTTKDCTAVTDTCRHCSENHKSKECPGSAKKCANCQGDHPSTYNGCPKKQEAVRSKKTTTLTQAQASAKATDEMECIKLALTLTATITEALTEHTGITCDTLPIATIVTKHINNFYKSDFQHLPITNYIRKN